MSLDERIQHAEASAKAAQKRVKRLELEKRKRLLLALGRYVIKKTKAASVAEFQDNFVIVAWSQGSGPKTGPKKQSMPAKTRKSSRS